MEQIGGFVPFPDREGNYVLAGCNSFSAPAAAGALLPSGAALIKNIL